MEKLANVLKQYAEDGPTGGKVDIDYNHIFLRAAAEWAQWCVLNTTGERLDRGLAIVKALCSYTDLDDAARPQREEGR